MNMHPIKHIRRLAFAIQKLRMNNKIDGILANSLPPVTSRAEAAFEHLQSTCNPPTPYGYTPRDVWSRGVERSKFLTSIPGMETLGKHVLEVACGDGLVGTLLHHYGHKVIVTDSSDWRDPRAKIVPFHCCDVCSSIPVVDDHYDLIYSYNAFEHFDHPEKAFDNIVECVRPGGYIYLEFSPLFASPWGLHAYGTFNMPYPQFLFSSRFIQKTYNEFGIRYYGMEQREPIPVNKWRYEQFMTLFQRRGLSVLEISTSTDASSLDLVLKFPETFRGRQLTRKDLVIDGIKVLLQKL